jgi:very-short-patch-repair endonuclease
MLIQSIEIQKCFDNYKVDIFIKELNIVVEFDENHHTLFNNKKEDKIRQSYIEDKYNVFFIRHNEKQNINNTINKILMYAKNKSINAQKI